MVTQTSNYPAGARRCCQRLDQSLSPAFFRALCDENRLRLLVQLAGCRTPCSVSRIAECCPVDLSVVSRHLAVLREAGLVEARKQGKEVYYRVRFQEVVRRLRDVADAMENCCPETCC